MTQFDNIKVIKRGNTTSYQIIDFDFHDIWAHRNPQWVEYRCRCGWSCRESRRQSAWGRAKKMRAQLKRHIETAD